MEQSNWSTQFITEIILATILRTILDKVPLPKVSQHPMHHGQLPIRLHRLRQLVDILGQVVLCQFHLLAFYFYADERENALVDGEIRPLRSPIPFPIRMPQLRLRRV